MSCLVVTDNAMGRLNKGPGQIRVAVFRIVGAFLFLVAEPLAFDAPAIRRKVSDRSKPMDIAGL